MMKHFDWRRAILCTLKAVTVGIILITATRGEAMSDAANPTAIEEHCLRFCFLDGRPTILACANSPFNGLSQDDFRFPDGCDLKISFSRSGGGEEVLFRGGEEWTNPFHVAILPGHGIVVTRELEVVDPRRHWYYPLTQQEISCQRTRCAISEERCVLQIPKDMYRDTFMEFEKRKEQDSRAGASAISPDDLVGFAKPLYIRALSGDAEAANALRNLSSRSLSEADSEIIHGYQHLYEDDRKICKMLP